MENQLKATELRIGNLINPDNPIMVEAWMLLPESKINFIGIQLTEDILVKLGFEKFKNAYKREDIVVNGSREHWDVRFVYNDHFIKNIQFVHHLQNLYFCLMDEELTFKN